MQQPTLRFRPLRPAVAVDSESTLELLISVAAPPPPEPTGQQRPGLNLALVIDRSGSMAGGKLSHARKAARFLVSQLTERDRLALVVFDDEVNVLMPSQQVRNPLPFIAAINHIHSGGSTALFDGWMGGAMQVAEHLNPASLNRVLLLSDGEANCGLTDRGEIATRVRGLTERGISTSAFGLGLGFDEDLMGAVAQAGDGTLAHIESPEQLPDLYASELQGLASTCARKVSLGIRTKNGAELVEVLNDLPRTTYGNYQLPSLHFGQEFNVGVRLRLPAWSANQEICSVRLAWDSSQGEGRQKRIDHLTLPVMGARELAGLAQDALVAEELAILEANRARQQAMQQLDLGDLDSADFTLAAMSASLSQLNPSQRREEELALLAEKRALLKRDHNRARKSLSRESYRSSLDVWSGDRPSQH